MKNQKVTNLQKVEQILLDINANMTDMQIVEQSQNQTTCTFDGHIGADVNLQGTWIYSMDNPSQNSREYTYEEAKLMTQGQQFATVGVKNGLAILEPTASSEPANMFWVVSAQYGADGVVTKTNDADRQLQVFHAQNETAEAVIEQICATIAQSKQKAVAKKLSTLQLSPEHTTDDERTK